MIRLIHWLFGKPRPAKPHSSRLCDKCKEFALPGKTVCAECGE